MTVIEDNRARDSRNETGKCRCKEDEVGSEANTPAGNFALRRCGRKDWKEAPSQPDRKHGATGVQSREERRGAPVGFARPVEVRENKKKE